MPRGLRAVDLAVSELHEALHHVHYGQFTFVSPDTDVLDVFCWCQATVVAVPQWQVRYLSMTLSCGRTGCSAPGETDTYVSDGAKVLRPTRVAGYSTTVITQRRRAYIARTIAPARRSQPTTLTSVGERRDRVAAAWRAGRTLRYIALDLNVPISTVKNDLHHLRSKGAVR